MTCSIIDLCNSNELKQDQEVAGIKCMRHVNGTIGL